ncbi:MAG: hypothetical protein ABJB85_09225 [Nitrososphaerota archaeon]
MLEKEYIFCLEKFGWGRVDFSILVKAGTNDDVEKKSFGYSQVTFVGKSIGAHCHNKLWVETIVKDNSQILDLMEEIKGVKRANEAIWSEIVKVVGKKRSISSNIIDQQ